MSAFSPALHRFGDVSVRLSVELGRTDMPLRDVLSLGEGSVVPLNRLTDELLDVTANGKVIAKGEVVAENGRFALRIVSLAGDEADSHGAMTSPDQADPVGQFATTAAAPADVPSDIAGTCPPSPDAPESSAP